MISNAERLSPRKVTATLPCLCSRGRCPPAGRPMTRSGRRCSALHVAVALLWACCLTVARAGCPGVRFGEGQASIAQDYVSPDGEK